MKKILIGDEMFKSRDFKENFELDYREVLEEADVTFVSDSKELVALAKTGEYDVVITELRWPSEDRTRDCVEIGYQVLDQIDESVPVRIVMTTKDVSQYALEVFKKGASYCSGKRPSPEIFEGMLSKPKKILVIEDNEQHILDARRELRSKPGVSPIYARTYSEASDFLSSVDGIISDIYFPLNESNQWNQPEPIGVRVAIEASKEEVPFVLCTAGFHHGRRYEWINQLAKGQGWDLISPKDHSNYENDAMKKDWKRAYETLDTKLA